jgi:hypothetical protein
MKLKNKKGIEMSLKAVTELVLAAIVILGTIVLLNMIFNSFSADDYSLDNFNALGSNILSMTNTLDEFSTKIMPYHISDDYFLVGFSSEWDDNTNVISIGEDEVEKIKKPTQCLGEACLCIYNVEEYVKSLMSSENQNKPVRCINLGTNTYISGADSYEQHFGNERTDTPEDLALRQARKEFIIQRKYFEVGGHNNPNIRNPNHIIWQDIHNVEQYFPEETQEPPQIDYSNLNWYMDYLTKGKIEKDGDYEDRYDYDDGEPKDGVIDGYPYREIYEKFPFNKLFPLNHEYFVLFGGYSKSGCNIIPPYDKDDNPIDDCSDSQDYDEFGTRNLYIEKYNNEDGETHILIAPYEGMILGRYYSAQDIQSELYYNSQVFLQNCPFPMGSSQYQQLESISIDYEDEISSEINTNPYPFEPEIIYAIIFAYNNQEDYTNNDRYGLLRLHQEDIISTCQIQETQIETELLDAEKNIECGLQIFNNYYEQVQQNTNLNSDEIINNTLALFDSRDSSILNLQDSEPAWKNNQEGPTYLFVEEVNKYKNCLIFSSTLNNPLGTEQYPAVGGQCFPVAEGSLNVNKWSYCGDGMNCDFGNCRGDCRNRDENGNCVLRSRCHAGYDIWTKAPGHILAIEDGIVQNIYHFYSCEDGWGGPGEVNAVIIDHGDYSVNYGEIDAENTFVEIGENVQAGQVLGIASHCGMLHFELYEGEITENTQWPDNEEVVDAVCGSEWNYCLKNQELLSKKPEELKNPEQTLENLKDKMCSSNN